MTWQQGFLGSVRTFWVHPTIGIFDIPGFLLEDLRKTPTGTPRSEFDSKGIPLDPVLFLFLLLRLFSYPLSELPPSVSMVSDFLLQATVLTKIATALACTCYSEQACLRQQHVLWIFPVAFIVFLERFLFLMDRLCGMPDHPKASLVNTKLFSLSKRPSKLFPDDWYPTVGWFCGWR